MSARRPLALYQALLETVPGDDDASRVRALRALLSGPRDAWPDALRQHIAASGVSVAYLTRGLLSIHRFAPEVRAALEAGLPFAIARRVNTLPTASARTRALAPLTQREAREGRLLPRGLAAQVDRRARAEATTRHDHAGTLDTTVDTRGWLPPTTPRTPPRGTRGDIWTFEPPARARAKEEPLDERVVEALLARTLPNGGDLVDATAGGGTIARVARRHGVRSWSGDIAPSAPFVHEADARTLLTDPPPGIAPGCADLLVVHPPSYPVWASTSEDDSIEAYQDALGDLLAGPLGVVRPGGVVVMITRPVRERRVVSIATSYLADAFTLSGVTLEAYVLAVAPATSQDWHLLIGGVPR
jgi:hypothetical protein